MGFGLTKRPELFNREIRNLGSCPSGRVHSRHLAQIPRTLLLQSLIRTDPCSAPEAHNKVAVHFAADHLRVKSSKLITPTSEHRAKSLRRSEERRVGKE